MDRRSIFRSDALEAQAYGEIGEPRLTLPRWTMAAAILLLLILGGLSTERSPCRSNCVRMDVFKRLSKRRRARAARFAASIRWKTC
ncbi:hypothetical protein [Erythrobacter sp. JK5]|uniref:hypothetical protein n=1 Tax=Erythrobacter sp. JK5 TaxID=2829500 RepID=UPI001BA6848C|nr:hypothetical protein [Erythrobacter sp. JK5]QUL38781.1 hypothetical protein KDC96_05260 [Erythrobacter sp. JK5]